jgi:fumarylacetoacetate (FAA) hydrolase family protein
MPTDLRAAIAQSLPEDGFAGALAGRVWRPDAGGPSVVSIRQEGVVDITAAFPTMRDLCEAPDPAAALRAATGDNLGDFAGILANTPPEARDHSRPWLLAPIDLQAVKAAGVTFAISMLERVIEERARGDLSAATALRAEVQALIGDDLARLKPGSPQAMALKQMLIEKGAWSQYLEVGIGPDAEIFTKSQPMAAIGTGTDAGVHPGSSWNNPEPEVVLVADSHGRAKGATLGNDVNLRDFEGRSALLLSKAKDNNASCAIGPFIRLFDSHFTMDDVRQAHVELVVEGQDNFRLEGESSMAEISRDPEELVRQAMSEHHYPDGFVLFLGTLFAPVQDRDEPGRGFTHKMGDVVRISAPKLGALVNRVTTSKAASPWKFGIRDLMRNLAGRGLIDSEETRP